VADAERLPLAAEDHFLMGDQARQAHGVDRQVDVAPRRVDQLGAHVQRAQPQVDIRQEPLRPRPPTPIVGAVSGDPIALGFTKNLSQPTANVTGFTTFNDTLSARRFEMLHEIVPAMRTAALIWAAANPQQALLESQTRQAAKGLDIELLSLPVRSADDVAAAMAGLRDKKVAALIVAADPLTVANGRIIIDECIAMKLPAMHTFLSEAKNGALMAYGIDVMDSYRRTAEYVDQLLKGKRVADLPFQEPTRFTLAINLKTARAIDVSIPATVLALADEVIE